MKRLVFEAAAETGAIVTAEDNVIFGGLGSAATEVLVKQYPVPMQRIGMRDGFAELGPYLAVIDRYGMSARHIAQAVNEVLKRKPTVKVKAHAKQTSKPKANVTKSKVKAKADRKR